MTRFVSMIALICCLASVKAQVFLRNFNTNDGLAGVMTYDALQDHKGQLWIATNSGVSLFDGYDFKNYYVVDGLEDSEVLKIKQDRQGRIWFLSLNGKLCYFDKGKIHNSRNHPALAGIHLQGAPSAFFEDSGGNIWISSIKSEVLMISPSMEVMRFNSKEEWGLFSPQYFWEDGVGNLWGAGQDRTDDSIYFSFYNHSLDQLHRYGLEGKMRYFSGYEKGRDGKIRFTAGSRVYEFDGQLRELVIEGLDSIRPQLNALMTSSDINLMFLGGTTGAYQVERKGGQWKLQSSLLDGKAVSSISRDHEGSLWLTTLSEGIYQAPINALPVLDRSKGLLEDRVVRLTTDTAGGLWIAYDRNEVTHYCDGELKHISLPLYRNAIIYDLYSDEEGGIWVAAGDMGFLVKEGKAFIVGNLGKSITRLDQRTLLTGMGFKIDLPTGNLDTMVNPQIWVQRTYAFAPHAEYGILLGTMKGLASYRDEQVTQLFPDQKFSQLRVNDVLVDDHNDIWLGTNGLGLIWIKGESVRSIQMSDGLMSEIVQALAMDEEGNIWAATSGGLNRIIPSDRQDFPIQINGYSRQQGLPSNEINDLLILDEKIALATGKGLLFFDPEDVIDTLSAPRIWITGLRDGEKQCDLEEREGQPYSFPYWQKELQIDFLAPSYLCGSHPEYRYRLGGYDSEWKHTYARSVTFEALQPGDYQFEVGARVNGGEWSPQAATLNFNIARPFWQTWWFRIILLLAIVGILWKGFVWRLRVLRRRADLHLALMEAEQKALQAQMNPHFIFNSMNAIQSMILGKEEKKALDYLSRFGRLIRLILQNSRQKVIPLAEEIDFIQNYLELELLRLDHGFETEIVAHGEALNSGVMIPSMLLQPFVENAIWHGLIPSDRPGKLAIHFYQENEAVRCVIEDNGVGRKETTQQKGHESLATKMISERLNLLRSSFDTDHASLEIEDLRSEDGSALGTRVTIILPIVD